MRTVWAIALGVAAFRFLLFRGLDLYADEAYYWMWSRHPATGYFDHPPMVAWLIAASSAILPGETGVRILFVLCGGLAVVFAGLIGRELSDDPRVPAVAALLAATAPMLMITGGLALPDAPVEAAYAGGTWLVARARGRGWIPAGVAVGLALLSKYSAALMAPALLLLVLLDRDLRRELSTPWPWLGGVVAILVFLPNLIWNATHDWMAILFQIRHGTGTGASLRSFFEYLGGLLGGAGAVALPLGLWGLVRARDSVGIRVATATVLPIAITFASALRGPVEANWSTLVYPALCGAAAAQLARMRPAWSQGLLAFTVGLGMIFAVGLGLEVRRPTLIPPGSEVVRRFRGWPELAAKARAATGLACGAVGDPPGCGPDDPFVYPSSYQEAGELAFYAGWTRFGPASERPSQLDLWNQQPRPGEAFVTIGVIPEEKRLFRGEGPGPTASAEVRLQGAKLHEIHVAAWKNWQGALPRRVTDLEYLKDVYPR